MTVLTLSIILLQWAASRHFGATATHSMWLWSSGGSRSLDASKLARRADGGVGGGEGMKQGGGGMGMFMYGEGGGRRGLIPARTRILSLPFHLFHLS